jgi:hypothetical protein
MGLGDLVNLARKVDRLLEFEAKYGAAFDALEAKIAALSDRVTKLETREELLTERARSAASTTASVVASAAVSDLALRIGRPEERSAAHRLGAP